MGEYTQWSVMQDLTNRILYYYDYYDMNMKAIDLKKLVSEHPAGSKIIPITEDFNFTDMTKAMKDRQ